MSSSDTNLTVVNSMTEAYMETLKNSSGKIPSMANQIIITDEEENGESGEGSVNIDDISITENTNNQIQTVAVIDQKTGNANKQWTGTKAEYDALPSHDADTFYNTIDENISNIDIESVTTVYDMSSTDASLNWGLTSGILGNVTAYKDLTAYEKLIFVPRVYNMSSINTGGWSGNYVLDLTTKKPDDTWCVAGYTSAYSDSAATGEVNKETWNFVFFYNPTDKELKWRVTFNGNSWNNNSVCYIAKIYGVKKKSLGVITGSDKNLVADVTLTSATSTVNITGLDLVADGGVYDIIVNWSPVTATADYAYMYFNDVQTSGTYAWIEKYYPSYAGETNYSDSHFRLGHSGTYDSFVVGTISIHPAQNHNSVFYETINGSFGSAQYSMNFVGTCNPFSNVTKITFTMSKTFAVGSRFRIYKRSTNNARITS